MKVEEDFYAYLWENTHDNNCNSYVIREKGAILIDPGHSRHIPDLFKQMKKDGITPEEIALVILTHSHPDHLEGLDAFVDQPVKIAMSREEERYLMESGRLLFEMMRHPLPEFRIDFYLNEGDLHWGEKVFHIYHTPGHSPGSLSIHWLERKALFTGDLVFYGGIGRTDFLEGNPKLMKESIERMSRLNTEILLPGHGELVMGKEKVLQNFEFLRQSFYAYL